MHLKSHLEKDFIISISRVAFTSTHLLALYQDDLEDAACFAGIKYYSSRDLFKPILWETATVYAGHGLGLCENWQNVTLCRLEDARLPKRAVFAVHYSRNALTTLLAIIRSAVMMWEPDYRHRENFTLGSDAISEYSNSDDYWVEVKETLLYTMHMFPGFWPPEKIFVTGESVFFEHFLKVLEATMGEALGDVPPIIFSDPVEVSSKAAAEIIRRGPAWWSDWQQEGNFPWIED